MRRREFFQRSAASAALLALGARARGDAPQRPNVLLIMADDLGIECLGAYGGESYATPNLDRLAKEGMRFTHCYSTPKCVPSRVNILTGRYGFRTGQAWGHIPDDEVTFGTVMRDAGYATAVAGKWQLALLKDNPGHPQEKGFEDYACWAWHEGPRYYDPLIWQDGQLRDEEIDDRYGPEVFTEFLTGFMQREAPGPFLAYYPMCLTHFAKTGGRYKEPPGPDGEYQTFKQMVERMDARVGELITALDRFGLSENTLVLFTADNGSPRNVYSIRNGKRVQGGKSTHTETGTHVPLIAHWPGTTPAGATCDDLIDFSDFMPTLADLAHTKAPQDRPIDGVSFLPQLRGQPGNPRDWVYTEYEGLAWIRTHRWKLYSDGRFYNLENDPEERQPLKADQMNVEAQEKRAWLAGELERLRGAV